MALRRLDAELVKRGLARSREIARDLIVSGAVEVDGIVADRPARQVQESVSIKVRASEESSWVSRGSGKLLGALEVFPAIDCRGLVCLDAGASTGGFTSVLLQRGAAKVYAVDVGYGQLAWSLQTDDRVVVMDRTNIRNLTPTDLEELPQLIASDLSFISLRTVMPALIGVTNATTDMLLMVKPQFEVGRERLGRGGVVRDPQLRVQAVIDVANSAWAGGYGVAGVAASPLPGPSGNVEYFLWLRRDHPKIVEDDVVRVVTQGPQ